MNSLILRNALCAVLSPIRLERADVRIADGTITEVGPTLRAGPDDIVEDLHGALLMPGLVCAHTHLYSSLSRGMPGPEGEPENFPAILEKIWWKLDRALDEDAIRFSAIAGALEAVRCGVTTIVDHHASPNLIRGSLSIIENALSGIGVRAVLCYETSDRDGPGRRDEGLAENEEFVARRRSHGMVRGLVGAHASFTLSDESLRMLGEMVERLDSGLHIHVAEDPADQERTRANYGRDILDRFRAFGLLRRRSVFAHCLHLSDTDYADLRSHGPWLVHNPRSNMNNAVGHAPLHQFGERAALGTDGFPADMFEELRTAFFKNREANPRIPPSRIVDLLNNGQRMISEIFDRPFGGIDAGSPADLVLLDYLPPTPMTAENLPYHVLFGLRSSMVESVMINGTWVMRDRKFGHLQEDELLRDAAAAAARLWRKMHA